MPENQTTTTQTFTFEIEVRGVSADLSMGEMLKAMRGAVVSEFLDDDTAREVNVTVTRIQLDDA